jgi:hypothetical protein
MGVRPPGCLAYPHWQRFHHTLINVGSGLQVGTRAADPRASCGRSLCSSIPFIDYSLIIMSYVIFFAEFPSICTFNNIAVFLSPQEQTHIVNFSGLSFFTAPPFVGENEGHRSSPQEVILSYIEHFAP